MCQEGCVANSTRKDRFRVHRLQHTVPLQFKAANSHVQSALIIRSARKSITTFLCWNGVVKYPAARGSDVR